MLARVGLPRASAEGKKTRCRWPRTTLARSVTPVAFGRYQLLKRLAVGGMAEIYLAKLTGVQGFEKLVVIKRILPNLAADPRFVQMFLDEARLAASLNHPNVVQIFELGEEQGAYFIAMEFIAGDDLSNLSKAARQQDTEVPLEVAARIIAEAAQGLHYAHTLKDLRGQPLNLVHRDVTLSNILVTYSGQVKLVDFGIAKAESQQQKTTAGGLKGKYAYMSPEQIIGQVALDARSDVFSLGICAFELFVGKRLFKRENELAIISDIVEGEVPAASSVRPDVPAELDAIIARALEKDRARRYQSAQEFQQALEGWLRQQPNQTGTAEVADFMALTFADQQGAYQRVLAQLPTATTEQLAKLLAESEARTQRKAGTGSGTGSGSMARLDDGDDEQSVAVRVRRKRSPWLLPGVIAGVVAALALVGLVLTQKPAQPENGSIELITSPGGAAIKFNGERLPSKTPTTLPSVPFGTWKIEVALEGYEPEVRDVTLDARANSRQLSIELKKAAVAPGTLKVVTTPPGAAVVLDGKKLEGVTPLEVPVAAAQEHLVRVSLAGYLDDAQTVELGAAEQKELSLALQRDVPVAATPAPVPDAPPVGKPSGGSRLVAVGLRSSPPADVFQGGTRLGRTPFTARLNPGRVTLRFVNAAEDLNCERALTIDKGGGDQSVTFSKGKLAFSLEPWADVYLSDKKLGTTPIAPREFYEGRLQFRFVNSEEGAIKSATVTVVPGKTTVVREWPR